jgi:ketosteroid isomerase-like protein
MNLAGWIIAFSLLLVGSTGAQAQQEDIATVKAANQSFYAAFSARDSKAMRALWANKPYVVNIGPGSKAVTVGYDDVAKMWDNAINDNFSKVDAQITTISQVQSDGKLAWVAGLEKATLTSKSGGDPRTIENFVTNIFEKQGDRWLMVVHHAQLIPK